jgi:hypothetical protein
LGRLRYRTISVSKKNGCVCSRCEQALGENETKRGFRKSAFTCVVKQEIKVAAEPEPYAGFVERCATPFDVA